MAGRTKALGAALVAALAISGIATSVAPADEVHSGSASGFTYATIDQHVQNIVDTYKGTIKCTTIKGEAKFAGTTVTEATVTGLVFETCMAFGLPAHIEAMGCTYTLTGSTATTGFLDIVCPTTAGGVTDEITVTPTQGAGNAICHVDFPEQRVAVNISNKAATGGGIPDDIEVEAEATDTITYTSERTSTTICPETGHHEEALYTRPMTATGFENAAHTIRTGLTYT
jgi:hypothetical protein